METWRKAIDSGLTMAVDFHRAFDCVSHPVLLDKLCKNFGICDQALGCIASYLNGTKQYTVVNGNNSDTMAVSIGIPQGLVIGLTLLSLFTSDLPSSFTPGSIYLFPDDTTMYCLKQMADEVVAQFIVSRGELVMKPGKLQRNNSLLWFLHRHVITTLHTDKQNGVSTVIKP